MKYDFYVAGPFFNDDQLKSLKSVEAAAINFVQFQPRRDAGVLGDKPTQHDMLNVFMEDVKAIDDSKFVLADLTYHDTGTSFELGYAFAKHIPVIIFCDETKGRKLNLMLAASSLASFTKIEDLKIFLNILKKSAFTGEIE